MVRKSLPLAQQVVNEILSGLEAGNLARDDGLLPSEAELSQRYQVSRATVYNTLELLVSCDLVTKHQFGKNMAQFEKSYGYKQHDHIICIDCGKVVEFCDPRIGQIENMMGTLLNFDIKHHSLNMYGNCTKLRDGYCEDYTKN